MIEKTLVLVKPDGVQRGLVGEVLKRFENAGLKIVGMKMLIANEELSRKHYTEDISKRRGEKVREKLVKFLQEAPVVVVVLQGINAVENVRKMVGVTEPKAALPGTIRGDFSHVSFTYADKSEQAVKNIVHASSSVEEAGNEISIWFKPEELHEYRTVHETHTC